MSAYVIFIKEITLDQAELETYASLVGKAVEGHPAELLAAYGKLEVLEGSTAEGVVIVKFPSIEEARTWYLSPTYQAAAEHRKKGAIWNVFVTEGLE